MMLTVDELIAFETKIADLFNAGKIRSPVHLEAGNELELIEIFKHIREQDWVLGSWRQHLKCLLKGVPPDELLTAIVEGRSMTLCFAKQKIISSAILGGILPIALGIAKSIQRRDSGQYVYCFMGDMTSESGVAHECIKYAANHGLPVRFIIEDNNQSTCTPTREVWGTERLTYEHGDWSHDIMYYRYNLTKYPHSGAGKRVQF